MKKENSARGVELWRSSAMTGNANNARRLDCWASCGSCQPVESLLNVCWSTMKLHTTPSLLRPRAKPFPLSTMSKDSAECKQRGRLDACTVYVWSFLLRLWGTAGSEEQGLVSDCTVTFTAKACKGNQSAESRTLCLWFARDYICGFTQEQEGKNWGQVFFCLQSTGSNDTHYL